MKVTVIAIVIDSLKTVNKDLIKGREYLEKKRTNRDHPNYIIIKMGQKTEKCHRDLRRLAITQTPVESYQLRLE